MVSFDRCDWLIRRTLGCGGFLKCRVNRLARFVVAILTGARTFSRYLVRFSVTMAAETSPLKVTIILSKTWRYFGA